MENIPFTNSYITSRQFSKGSRIVILLNINKSPFEQINYGTGKNVSDETIRDAKEPLQIKWFNDSYINIPVLR
jgi:biotin-(acetyl-CoA carboxylase) ligase